MRNFLTQFEERNSLEFSYYWRKTCLFSERPQREESFFIGSSKTTWIQEIWTCKLFSLSPEVRSKNFTYFSVWLFFLLLTWRCRTHPTNRQRIRTFCRSSRKEETNYVWMIVKPLNSHTPQRSQGLLLDNP